MVDLKVCKTSTSKNENSVTKMTSDQIINKVDETFGNELTKVIKTYVIELVNHEVDVITDSDWFDEKIKQAIEDLKK